MPDPAVEQQQKQSQKLEVPSGTSATSDALQEPLVDPLTQPKETTQGGGGGGGGGGKKLSWREALGNFLGDALYDGLRPALTEESLKKTANDAWNGAVDKVGAWIRSQADTPDESAIAKRFSDELTKALKDKAGSLINFNLEGVAEDIADFARKNPELVILGALAGAAAFIATNQSIPDLKQKLGLGKAGKLTVGAKFTGGFLDLFKSIDETVKALELAYKVGGFQAGGDYERKEDGSRQIKGDASYTLKDSYLKDGKEVSFDRFKIAGNGGVQLAPSGKVKGSQVGGSMNLNLGDQGQHQFSASGGYQQGVTDKGAAFEKSQAKLGYASGPWSATGSFSQSTVPAGTTTEYGLQGGFSGKSTSLTGSASLQDGPKGILGVAGLQGSYTGGPLSLSGGAMFGTDGRYDVNAKGSYNFGNGWKANAGGSLTNLPNTNGVMQQNWGVNGGFEYQKNNKFLNFQGNYGSQGGGFTVGAGIRF